MLTDLAMELAMEDVLQAFKDHCSAHRTVVFERVQYWSHQRTAGTSVNTFMTELRHRSNTCEFGASEDDMLRDKLVLSVTDSTLKKRLIQERGLTLHRAIDICRATEQEKTPSQAMETEHEVQEVPVDAEIKAILPDKSLHHDTSRQLGSQSVPSPDETGKLVLAAFMPIVHLHRFQLQQPSLTHCASSDGKNVEQLLPESLHVKEEPEMLSECQEENQLCVQQETSSATCPAKCEDEEKPQASQLHWRQLTEINMKEEPSTCSLDELMTRQTVGINNKAPEAAQNHPDPSSLERQAPEGTETDWSQTEGSSKEDDEDCWQIPLSKSETEAEADCDSTKKNRKMSDSSKNAETGRKASKTRISSFQQKSSEKVVQVKMTSECVGGEKASRGAASKLRIHTAEKPFQCDVCSKCYIRKADFNKHTIIHTREKPFKCDVCGKCFTQKGELKSHLIIHTAEKPFECDVCSKCFNRKAALRLHMRLHKGEKPFKCDVCGNCFPFKHYLKSHMRIHTGEKPFECDVCSKCFLRKAELNLHTRIHTGEKPFSCDVCKKCFSCKVNLQLHKRIHTGEKPFECDYCSKRFTRKHHQQSHMRVHTGEKPFKCNV